MLYSIYDYDALSSLSYSVEKQPEMSIAGGTLFLRKNERGDMVIDGLFSTDPDDYLNDEYAIGKAYKSPSGDSFSCVSQD